MILQIFLQSRVKELFMIRFPQQSFPLTSDRSNTEIAKPSNLPTFLKNIFNAIGQCFRSVGNAFIQMKDKFIQSGSNSRNIYQGLPNEGGQDICGSCLSVCFTFH